MFHIESDSCYQLEHFSFLYFYVATTHTHLLMKICFYSFRNHEKMISQEIRLLRRAASCVDPMDNSDRDR